MEESHCGVGIDRWRRIMRKDDQQKQRMKENAIMKFWMLNKENKTNIKAVSGHWGDRVQLQTQLRECFCLCGGVIEWPHRIKY